MGFDSGRWTVRRVRANEDRTSWILVGPVDKKAIPFVLRIISGLFIRRNQTSECTDAVLTSHTTIIGVISFPLRPHHQNGTFTFVVSPDLPVGVLRLLWRNVSLAPESSFFQKKPILSKIYFLKCNRWWKRWSRENGVLERCGKLRILIAREIKTRIKEILGHTDRKHWDCAERGRKAKSRGSCESLPFPCGARTAGEWRPKSRQLPTLFIKTRAGAATRTEGPKQKSGFGPNHFRQSILRRALHWVNDAANITFSVDKLNETACSLTGS